MNADIRAWLGDTEVTDDQADAITEAFDRVHSRFPDRDLADSRELALSAAVMVILGDDTLAGIAEQWHQARKVERDRMAALTGALIATPGSEVERAAQAGVHRATVRKALGKG